MPRRTAPASIPRVSLRQLWAFLAIALPVLAAVIAPLPSVDLAYHLRAGAEILATRAIPSVDTWTFTANAGDRIALSIGEVVDTNGLFQPWIRIQAPNGTLLSSDFEAGTDGWLTSATRPAGSVATARL